MSNMPRIDKRQRNIRLPIEVCVKYERMAGFKRGAILSRADNELINRIMASTLADGVRHIILSAKDYADIAKEIEENEAHRNK